MKLYAEYIKEREGKDCIYNEDCFIVYKVYGKEASIIDIYNRPNQRGKGNLKVIVDKLVEDLASREVETVYGYTDESTSGWQNSERLMLKYGFKKIKSESEYNHYALSVKGNINGK